MVIKRLISSAAAAAVLSGVLSIGAFADGYELELLLAPAQDISEGVDQIIPLGNRYYAYNNRVDSAVDPDIDGIIYIGEEEIAQWRESGEFTYREVSVDIDLENIILYTYFQPGGSYGRFLEISESGETARKYIVHHSDDNSAIHASEFEGDNWFYTRPDGYSVSTELFDSWVTVTVTAPDGRSTSVEMDCLYYDLSAVFSGNNAAYIMRAAGTEPIGDAGRYRYALELDAIDLDGNVTKLESWPYTDNIVSWEICTAAEDHLLYYVTPAEMTARYYVYLPDTGEIEGLRATDGNPFGDYRVETFNGTEMDYNNSLCSLGERFWNGRAIAYFEPYTQDEGWFGQYALADMDTKTIISGDYRNMETLDGEIYLVESNEGKWGYIDANGKELGFFDDAADFAGDYAPVVMDGKVFLVDRDMNQVSGAVDADSVVTERDGLCYIMRDDQTLFMTYKTAESAPEPDEPETPDETEEPESSGDLTQNSTDDIDKANPATGVGITVLPLIAAAAGGVVLSRRRK